MLTDMRVRDLAVIADVALRFEPGLNVLTGETGAGKSMLVDALALLLGERASGDLVRARARDRAVVEAGVRRGGSGAAGSRRGAASRASISRTGRLVVRREIRVSGPNRAWANGSPTTVGGARRSWDSCSWTSMASTRRSPCSRRRRNAPSWTRLPMRSPSGQRLGAAFHAGAAAPSDEAALIERRDEAQRRADYLRHVVKEVTAPAQARGGRDARGRGPAAGTRRRRPRRWPSGWVNARRRRGMR